MPRTKRSNASRERSQQEQAFLLDFKRKSALELKKLELDLSDRINKALATIESEFKRFPSEYQKLTLADICDLLNDESSSEEEVMDDSVVEISDAGYATTSLSVSNESAFKGKTRPEKSSKNLKVPANIYSHTPKDKAIKMVQITPKIGPNVPVPVTRFARTGETVLSMTGSPIHAPGTSHSRVPNVSVPLHNGDVINIAPTASLRQSVLPALDPETVKQLRKLKEQIEKFLPQP